MSQSVSETKCAPGAPKKPQSYMKRDVSKDVCRNLFKEAPTYAVMIAYHIEMEPENDELHQSLMSENPDYPYYMINISDVTEVSKNGNTVDVKLSAGHVCRFQRRDGVEGMCQVQLYWNGDMLDDPFYLNESDSVENVEAFLKHLE